MVFVRAVDANLQEVAGGDQEERDTPEREGARPLSVSPPRHDPTKQRLRNIQRNDRGRVPTRYVE